MKWAETPDPDDADEDDIAEFEKMRKVRLIVSALSFGFVLTVHI